MWCLLLPAASHARAAVGTVTLSDPVPTLLDGPRVTSDIERLARGARAVQGVTADGVSQIIVAVSADTAGQQFTFTVYNDQSAPSASTFEDGALAAVGSTNFDHSQLATAAVTTSEGAMAFVVYRAPIDFARPGGGDDALAARDVSIHWTVPSPATSGSIPLTVLRPPVVLVHGLWSSPSTWSNFTPLITDARFSTFRANYATLNQTVAGSDPSGTSSSIAANALGFAFNSRYVAPQIDSFVNNFKSGHNPKNIPVSAIQADVVAHSMGGDITRDMPIMLGFASATTYGRGNVHKLITVDTPHLGSPLPIDLLPSTDGSDKNQCVRYLFNYGIGYTLISVKTPSGASVDGAMGDLRGNGSGDELSSALEALLSSSNEPPLQTQLLPTAFVAAIAGSTQLGGLDFCHNQKNWGNKKCTTYGSIQLACPSNPLVENMTSADWENNVMMGPSDALVPFTSEYNNYTEVPNAITAIHSASLEQLGLNGPGALQLEANAPADVIALLNTWMVNSSLFARLR